MTQNRRILSSGMRCGRSSLTFRRFVLPPSAGRRMSHVNIQVCVIDCMNYSSTLKMDVERSSEISVYFYQIIRSHIPKDSKLHSHWRDNLKSHRSCIIYLARRERKLCLSKWRIMWWENPYGSRRETRELPVCEDLPLWLNLGALNKDIYAGNIMDQLIYWEHHAWRGSIQFIRLHNEIG